MNSEQNEKSSEWAKVINGSVMIMIIMFLCIMVTAILNNRKEQAIENQIAVQKLQLVEMQEQLDELAETLERAKQAERSD